jgi:endonuclease IV
VKRDLVLFWKYIKNFIKNINHIIKHMPDNISLALETSAGQGSQIGYTLEDLGIIWDGVKHNNKHNKHNKNKLASRRVGICIDTAHIFTGGYDIKTEDGIKSYMNDFNKLIGWKNISTTKLSNHTMSALEDIISLQVREMKISFCRRGIIS